MSEIRFPRDVSSSNFNGNDLPNEVWSKILSFCRNPKDLCRLQAVSSRFKHLLISWPQIHQLSLSFKHKLVHRRKTFLIELGFEQSSFLLLPPPKFQQNIAKIAAKLTDIRRLSLSFAGYQRVLGFLDVIPKNKLQELSIRATIGLSYHQLTKLIRSVNQTLTSLKLDITFLVPTDESLSFNQLQKAVFTCHQLQSFDLALKCDANPIQDLYSPMLEEVWKENLKTLKLPHLVPHGFLYSKVAEKAPYSLFGAQIRDLVVEEKSLFLENYLEKVQANNALYSNHPLEALSSYSMDDFLNTDNTELLFAAFPKLKNAMEAVFRDLMTKRANSFDYLQTAARFFRLYFKTIIADPSMQLTSVLGTLDKFVFPGFLEEEDVRELVLLCPSLSELVISMEDFLHVEDMIPIISSYIAGVLSTKQRQVVIRCPATRSLSNSFIQKIQVLAIAKLHNHFPIKKESCPFDPTRRSIAFIYHDAKAIIPQFRLHK